MAVPREIEEEVLSEMAAEEQGPSDVDDSDAEETSEDVEAPSKSFRRNMSTEYDISVVTDDQDGFRGRFINLVDMFPPLPKKGDFEVSTIKNSPYFFS